MHKMAQEARANTVKKRRRGWAILKKQSTEFCLGTGLHGYKYVAHSQRSRIERVIWAIIVATALVGAIDLMYIAWQYNSSRPTVTVIESTHHGIWNYPFPAVTICNLNRVSLSRAKQFVRLLALPENVTEDFVVSQMGLLNELLSPGLYEENVTENLTLLDEIFDQNEYLIQDVIQEVTQECSSLILACKWRGNWTNCADMFTPSYSRDGACCSFNYVTTDDPRKPPKMKPTHVSACGYQTGLTLFVNPDPNDYAAAILGSYGVKVMIHYPYDYPDHNMENKLLGLDSQMFFSVSPEETYSTEDVRGLSVKTRECVFSDERHYESDFDITLLNLTYAQYTYKNCLSACRASTIKAKCHCIPYYFPQKGTRVCSLRDIKCLKEHASWYETSWPGVVLTSNNIATMNEISHSRPCGCLPDCMLYRYPVESSVGSMDRSHFYTSAVELESKAVPNGSMIHIFFSDLVSIQYRKHANYNWRNMFVDGKWSVFFIAHIKIICNNLELSDCTKRVLDTREFAKHTCPKETMKMMTILKNCRNLPLRQYFMLKLINSLASFGGLLGLFAGFSLMSGYELIYFFVIRVVADACMKRNSRKSKESENPDSNNKTTNRHGF